MITFVSVMFGLLCWIILCVTLYCEANKELRYKLKIIKYEGEIAKTKTLITLKENELHYAYKTIWVPYTTTLDKEYQLSSLKSSLEHYKTKLNQYKFKLETLQNESN